MTNLNIDYYRDYESLNYRQRRKVTTYTLDFTGEEGKLDEKFKSILRANGFEKKNPEDLIYTKGGGELTSDSFIGYEFKERKVSIIGYIKTSLVFNLLPMQSGLDGFSSFLQKSMIKKVIKSMIQAVLKIE